MREIKFRVWDTTLNKMMYNGGLTVCNNEITDLLGVPMQFTGLKDKNGKEIYEGDIVSMHERNYEIIFRPACFGINDDKNNFITYSTDWEVIGNIYENESLIK